MRKKFVVVLSAFIALVFAAPSFALEVDVSGTLRFQGVYNENASSRDSDKADSFRDMRLRVKTEMKITDKITLVTRFDALDKVLSSKDSAFDNQEDDDNIDFDRAYVKIVSPVGLFIIGRQEGVTWGTSWSDDESNTDRIKYILPIPVGDNKFYIGIVGEKVTEADKGYAVSNKDNDKYYISGTYVAENYRTGLLCGFYHFNTFQAPAQAVATKAYKNALATYNAAKTEAENVTYPGAYATIYALTYRGYLTAGQPASVAAAAAEAAAIAGAPDYRDAALASAEVTFAKDSLATMQTFGTLGKVAQGKVVLLAPYFTGKFGNFGITTELDYAFGTAEFNNPGISADDRDLDAYSFFVETTYDAGPLTFQLGIANSTGDADYTDDKIGSMGYVSPGADWEKMFILSSSGSGEHGSSHGMNNSLGGGLLGNHVGDGFATGSIAMLDGYQMLYAGVDYKLNESMDVGTVMCISKADETPSGIDDDQGIEVDLKFSWKFMKNIEYSATAAYLSAGKYWEERAAGLDSSVKADEDTIALFHKLEISF